MIKDRKKVMRVAEAKTNSGMSKNVAGALAYVLGPVTGLVFYLINSDPFVRFHAKQAIVVFGGLFVLEWVMGMTIILLPLIPLVSIAGFILWLVLILKAYKGEQWSVPFVGKFVNKIFKKAQ